MKTNSLNQVCEIKDRMPQKARPPSNGILATGIPCWPHVIVDKWTAGESP